MWRITLGQPLIGILSARPAISTSKKFPCWDADSVTTPRSRRLTQVVSRRLPGKEIMSSGSELGPAHTLVSLPSPLDSVKGRIYAEPVYSVVGENLRKRHEIVVSIDGEAVNIYDVSSLTLDQVLQETPYSGKLHTLYLLTLFASNATTLNTNSIPGIYRF